MGHYSHFTVGSHITLRINHINVVFFFSNANNRTFAFLDLPVVSFADQACSRENWRVSIVGIQTEKLLISILKNRFNL